MFEVTLSNSSESCISSSESFHRHQWGWILAISALVFWSLFFYGPTLPLDQPSYSSTCFNCSNVSKYRSNLQESGGSHHKAHCACLLLVYLLMFTIKSNVFYTHTLISWDSARPGRLLHAHADYELKLLSHEIINHHGLDHSLLWNVMSEWNRTTMISWRYNFFLQNRNIRSVQLNCIMLNSLS